MGPLASPLRFRTALYVATLGALFGLGTISGCEVDAPEQLPAGDEGAGGATPDEPTPNGGEAMFRALENDFFAACGGCHDAGGIASTPFLAGPDRYQTAMSWPGVVTKPASQSSLLTHAIKGGGHSGANLDSEASATTLLPAVTEWLEEEARGIVDAPVDSGPRVAPFAPIMGFNAVYLDGLGDDFRGMAMTFSASLLTDDALLLTQIQVHPTTQLGVHMVHPLFVVFPKGGEPDPDPVDSFSNLDQRFDPGVAGGLGPGTMILTNWLEDGKLSVAFETIEVLGDTGGTGSGGGGSTGGGCADVPAFQANAEPALGVCAGTCHSGQNGQATAAVDMSALGSDAAAACAQVKNRVNVSDPAASQLFVTTDPGGNAAHPYKFQNGADFAAFRDQVTAWIAAEN
jgi:hypothetical protein